MLTKSREDIIIALCQDLIKIKSYSGNEDEVVHRLKKAFTELNFDDYFIDKYGNIIGHIKGQHPGKKLLFDGHIDTVPVTDPSKWTHEPFGAEIDSGKIYGRGASDMKGALSAMICAASFWASDIEKDFAGDIYIAGVVHEECFEGVASREISSQVKPDFVVIGEASQLNLKIGQRGRAEIIVETFGQPAHSANPEKGINAVLKMMKLIERIDKIKGNHHEILGDGILVITDIKSSPYPGASVVPEYCKATYDRRILVDETKESVLQPIQEIIMALEKEDPEFKAKVSYAIGQEKCYTGEIISGERYFPAWLYNKDDEFVKQAYAGLLAAGINPEITHYSFCTNGSHYAGEAGIKTLGFGPSPENLAHTIDEYIEIAQLLEATKGYYALSKALL